MLQHCAYSMVGSECCRMSCELYFATPQCVILLNPLHFLGRPEARPRPASRRLGWFDVYDNRRLQMVNPSATVRFPQYQPGRRQNLIVSPMQCSVLDEENRIILRLFLSRPAPVSGQDCNFSVAIIFSKLWTQHVQNV